MVGENKFKTILRKMNDNSDKGQERNVSLSSSGVARNRVSKYNRERNSRKRGNNNEVKPTIINKIIGYFNASENINNDSLEDIKSRFKTSGGVEMLKRKLSSNPDSRQKSVLIGDTDKVHQITGGFRDNKESNFFSEKTNDENDIILKLIKKQQQLEQNLLNLKKDHEELKNEMCLLKQQHSEKNYIDMSLIKEKRKMNNLHSSDPILQPDESKINNSNIKKRDLRLMSFENLSPIKRQDSVFAKEAANTSKDNRTFETGNQRGNAITSSPSKSYRNKNNNVNQMLQEAEDEDDWRLREEDSVSSDILD
ncbi:hypothetical protein QEN19_000841 [Hanseniaspora menglaensis]